MTDRKREPLSEGYQFGDAHECDWRETGKCLICWKIPYQHSDRGDIVMLDPDEYLHGLTIRLIDWNVIEGEHFSADIANYVPKLGD